MYSWNDQKLLVSLVFISKPKSRLSPPTSPTAANNEESISKKLAEAEERKKNLEQEKAKKLASQLEKISLAKEKKEKEEEKFSSEVMEKIESKQVHAEELKKKQMDEFKEKVCLYLYSNKETFHSFDPKLQVSEHSSKIEKAQKELESAIEAAKAETQAALDKRMNNAKENKDVQLEVRHFSFNAVKLQVILATILWTISRRKWWPP